MFNVKTKNIDSCMRFQSSFITISTYELQKETKKMEENCTVPILLNDMNNYSIIKSIKSNERLMVSFLLGLVSITTELIF